MATPQRERSEFRNSGKPNQIESNRIRTNPIVYLQLVLVVLGLAWGYGRRRIVVVAVLRVVLGLDDDAVELDDAVAVVRPPGLRRPRVVEVLLAEPDPAEVVGAVAA